MSIPVAGEESATAAGLAPPRHVQTAVLITWLCSAGTAAFTVLLTVFYLWVGREVFAEFDSGTGNPRFWIVLAALVVLALCALASFLARQVLRGSSWAWWGLLALCVFDVVMGAIAFFFVLPPIIALVAILVAVLLCLPESRAWLRATNTARTH